MICGRRSVDRMILGHNDLQDEGCSALFSFLRSPAGRRYHIFEISLNSNSIGDNGLLEIGEYLKENEHLRELFVQNALNTSRLTLLSLTTNRALGDEFAEHFLSKLDAPHLRELHLSATGLTAASARHIAEFLASPRCRLRVFRCNGNSLGIKALCNHLSESDSDSASSSELGDSGDESIPSQPSSGSAPRGWVVCERMLKRLLFRNMTLKKVVEEEALQLLRYARAILLHSGPSSTLTQSRIETRRSPPPMLSFNALPHELQLYIFSFLAPTLSPAQLVRVYQFASSPHTLPPLLPRLLSSLTSGVHGSSLLCYPDPSLLGFGGGKVWPLGASSASTAGERCGDGQCMGSDKTIVCQRDKDRVQWLETVGCTAYEQRSVS
ncbi:hypothetical protein BDQ17DRAFT_1347580 [Cyathus striatus]|nr:hypothetical protein BDQ17DRAFT_1347580 [Cyathus striatus]